MSRIKITTGCDNKPEKLVAGLTPAEFSCLKGIDRPIHDQFSELREENALLIESFNNSILSFRADFDSENARLIAEIESVKKRLDEAESELKLTVWQKIKRFFKGK